MIKVNKLREITNSSFGLLNGVSILEDGNILVADGQDKVFLLDEMGAVLNKIEGTGLSKYSFKEPVAIGVSNDEKVFVADWHNHRVVIYDRSLKYQDEFGHKELMSQRSFVGNCKDLLLFCRSFFVGGSYYENHFKGEKQKKSHSWLNLGVVFYSFYYFINKRLVELFGKGRTYSDYGFNKPNGFAFVDDKVYISQKNARRISVHQSYPPYKRVGNIDSPFPGRQFGRLGNVIFGKDNCLYICDENSANLWKLSKDTKRSEIIVGADSGFGYFQPFSCAALRGSLIVVCGGVNFQVIDTNTKKVIYVSDEIGELHGVAFKESTNELYVVNRSSATIEIYEVYSDYDEEL